MTDTKPTSDHKQNLTNIAVYCQVHGFETYAKELMNAADALEDLEADKEMLDWLDVVIHRDGGLELEEHGEAHVGLWIERIRGGGYGDTSREAIADAMRKEAEQ